MQDYEKRPVVVIVGAGFGGITAARRLAKSNIRVLLIDRTNHHVFQPLLYQTATAALAPSDIASPIRFVPKSTASVLTDTASRTSPSASPPGP